ncbi:MAG: YceH family protein [Pseudomonadales bacterium]
MSLTLNANECRVLGCLLEKSVVTPDQYPLTLNALTNACNQKSSREPVMQMEQGAVQRTIRELELQHLVRTEENFKSRTEKYTQRFCNTPFSDFQFDDAQLAIVTLLLLRGAQTPGELRARSGRLHTFDDNQQVVAALNTLMQREEGDPLVAVLPRQPGRKDSEYVHLFAGPVSAASTVVAPEPAPPAVAIDTGTNAHTDTSAVTEDLQRRVSALEQELAALKARLGD